MPDPFVRQFTSEVPGGGEDVWVVFYKRLTVGDMKQITALGEGGGPEVLDFLIEKVVHEGETVSVDDLPFDVAMEVDEHHPSFRGIGD